jgi:hypothetical protein
VPPAVDALFRSVNEQLREVAEIVSRAAAPVEQITPAFAPFADIVARKPGPTIDLPAIDFPPIEVSEQIKQVCASINAVAARMPAIDIPESIIPDSVRQLAGAIARAHEPGTWIGDRNRFFVVAAGTATNRSEADVLAAAAALVPYLGDLRTFADQEVATIVTEWVAKRGAARVHAKLVQLFTAAIIVAWKEVSTGPQRLTEPDGRWYRADPGTLAIGAPFDRYLRNRPRVLVANWLRDIRTDPRLVLYDPARFEEPGRGTDDADEAASDPSDDRDLLSIEGARFAERRAALVVEGPDDRVGRVKLHLGPALHAVATVLARKVRHLPPSERAARLQDDTLRRAVAAEVGCSRKALRVQLTRLRNLHRGKL